ncbi:MAG: DUF3800 domain-containing protein [Candidatus Bathyarchaeota archaeon]|nr:DUF3800 domain-containing protein [Candidatus Bathyarchaeum tardum]
MYLLYLDESGDPSSWAEHNHFVIAGIGVYEFEIENLRKKLVEIQRKYFPEIKIPMIFHATEIHSGKKRYRNFPKEKRMALLKELYEIIQNEKFPKIAIFGAVLGIESAKNAYEDRSSTFEEVISGFNTFLVEGYRTQRSKRTGYGNKGLIIIDKNREEQYKQLLDTFQEEGTRYGYLANIVDIPYFARCKDTTMLQLADLCSYAIFRFFERNDDTYLKMIEPRIYRTNSGRMFGLKHITNGDCNCLSCANQKIVYTVKIDEEMGFGVNL